MLCIKVPGKIDFFNFNRFFDFCSVNFMSNVKKFILRYKCLRKNPQKISKKKKVSFEIDFFQNSQKNSKSVRHKSVCVCLLVCVRVCVFTMQYSASPFFIKI